MDQKLKNSKNKFDEIQKRNGEKLKKWKNLRKNGKEMEKRKMSLFREFIFQLSLFREFLSAIFFVGNRPSTFIWYFRVLIITVL